MRCLCSTQGLAAMKKLTRSYLGLSASISQAIQELNVKEVPATPSTDNPTSGMPDSFLLFMGIVTTQARDLITPDKPRVILSPVNSKFNRS